MFDVQETLILLQYTRSKLNFSVATMFFHSVCHHGNSLLRSSNVNITCSAATSLSPLMGKLFPILLLYQESHARYIKSRKLEEM